MTVIHIAIGMFTSNPMIPQYLKFTFVLLVLNAIHIIVIIILLLLLLLLLLLSSFVGYG